MSETVERAGSGSRTGSAAGVCAALIAAAIVALLLRPSGLTEWALAKRDWPVWLVESVVAVGQAVETVSEATGLDRLHQMGRTVAHGLIGEE